VSRESWVWKSDTTGQNGFNFFFFRKQDGFNSARLKPLKKEEETYFGHRGKVTEIRGPLIGHLKVAQQSTYLSFLELLTPVFTGVV
jgi:hypothetical protein